MGTLSVKLPAPLEARLDALVLRRGRGKSVLVREAIERLVDEHGRAVDGSVLDLLKDLKGAGQGRKDLSSNRKHLQGYGR